MPIIQLPNGRHQARLRGRDGKVISKVFGTKLDAERQLLEWRKAKKERRLQSADVRHITLNQYFEQWFEDKVRAEIESENSGWRKGQLQQYRDHVSPLLGSARLTDIRPSDIHRVLIEMAAKGMAAQTRCHVFTLLRLLFGDAIEIYEYVLVNPALRKFKPVVPLKEARYLNLEQLQTLLTHVEGRKYGLAIWIQAFLGLRCGELQALRWEDLDLSGGRFHLRRTYVAKTKSFRDYPKGKKQHSHAVPAELLSKLREAATAAKGELVVHSPVGVTRVLPEKHYLTALKGYCEKVEVPQIGTHGLRHSTSEMYLEHGASRDDLRQLFGHSTPLVTDRYIHDRGSRLEKVSNVIQLFEKKGTMKRVHAAKFE